MPSGNRSREFDLLCSCAGVKLSPERAARIASIARQPLDWNELLRQAEFHGVLPLMARSLASVAGVPPEIQSSLRSSFDANARRNLWFMSELLRIGQSFEAREIDLAPYKGPLLAQKSYGDIALRTFSDLDFLVARRDVERATAVLAELGYRPSKQQTPAERRFWLRHGYERAFDGAAGKYLVELQWSLAPRFFAVNSPAEELLHNSYDAVDELGVRGLVPADLVMALCLHAARHLWMRLIWICDLAETIRTQPFESWDLIESAKRRGVLRIVLINFWLVRRLLGQDLPPAIEAALPGDPQVEALGELFAARLARSAAYDFESTEYFRLSARLRERRRDRWRFFWRLFWTPGVNDIASIRLPGPLFPLYRLVRIVRLARRFV